MEAYRCEPVVKCAQKGHQLWDKSSDDECVDQQPLELQTQQARKDISRPVIFCSILNKNVASSVLRFQCIEQY